LLNYAQDKSVVRVEPDEEKGLMVYLGAEFHPPAVPEAEVPVISDEQPTEEPAPTIAGQPLEKVTKARRPPRRKPAGSDGQGGARRTSRPRRSPRPARRPRGTQTEAPASE